MTERIKKTVIVKGTISYSSEFAITITLKPTMYHMTAIMQRNAIQGIINSIENCKLSLICELTQNYNIHLHGTIKVPIKANKDVEHIVHDMFRNIKDIGYICVKQIEDYDHWKEYCLKDYVKTKRNLMNEQPVIRDDNDFFPLSDLLMIEHQASVSID